MNREVDLYDSHYPTVEDAIYREVRAEAFGEDLGQTSWITMPECDTFSEWLDIGEGQEVLEVGCGSGGVALRFAERFGATVVGVDINEPAVAAATARAERQNLTERARFRTADADQPLPFPEGTFDVVFCNDAVNHFRDRAQVLADWHRVLRPGGRCLYTDPIVVTGFLSNEEIAVRSSIGFFLFTPPGANERTIRESKLELLKTEDVTESVAATSERWQGARKKRRDALIRIEGKKEFEDLQRFLGTVHTLAGERRLSRVAYLCRKPG